MDHISPEQINKLLALSRIEMAEEDKISLAKDIQSILGYVSELSAVSTETLQSSSREGLRNVMREDGNAYERGQFREVLLEAAPAREGNYVKVKKIL